MINFMELKHSTRNTFHPCSYFNQDTIRKHKNYQQTFDDNKLLAGYDLEIREAIWIWIPALNMECIVPPTPAGSDYDFPKSCKNPAVKPIIGMWEPVYQITGLFTVQNIQYTVQYTVLSCEIQSNR